MICSLCGGEVTWRGPLSDLTHTECGDCGGRNCQFDEPYEAEDGDAELAPLLAMEGGG